MREQRKVVSILFADVVESTAFAADRDPEVVRSKMQRYFKRIGEIAGAYGGTVEKFAGDAAMVVFGVPAVHDDDAERAVRAALEIRDRAGDVTVRVGVNTGEAVTAMTEDRQFMVSGDTVNVAARLQQGASGGEVLVGALTHQLTRNVIAYEPHEPVTAKGKAEPLVAYRAVRAIQEIPTQARGVPGLRSPLVGRSREMRLLVDTFARAADDKSTHLFTVVGAAGIGKSRLVDEAVATIAATGARVLHGRCLPYGRGITYWPFIEIVRQDTGIDIVDAHELALSKLDRWLGELLNDASERPAVRTRLAVMLGLEPPESAMSDIPTDRVEREIAWAVRCYIEAVSASAPTIVIIDDLQWAEPPVVSILEQLAERLTEVPLLLICMARPEFLESHSTWSSGKPNATTITLDPLNAQQTGTLISHLLEIDALPTVVRNEIIERSAGTPLFCEEFIHMLIDEGVVIREGNVWKAIGSTRQIHVPQGINAVLAARLDLLPERERTALQAASVIGQRFGLRELEDLAGTEVESDLESLRRRGLVGGGDRPDDEYWFRHILIRDAAYASLPKSMRASLHDRFRAVLESKAGDPQQICEILAHHAERAFSLSLELDLDEDVVRDRAGHALDWLFTLADRARTRHDVATLEAALASIESATAMAKHHDAATAGRVRLLEAQLAFAKGEYPRAHKIAAEAAALAEEANLPSIVATARLTEAWVANWSLDEPLESFQAVIDRAIEACRRAGDARGEIEARHVGSNALWARGRIDEYIAVNEDLIRQAMSIGDIPRVAAITARLTPAEVVRGNYQVAREHMAEAESLAAEYGLRNVALRVQFDRAGWQMWRGELAEGARLLREYERAAVDAGAPQHQLSALRFLGYTLVCAAKPAEAAAVLDEALALSESTGERWNRTEVLAMRAQAALDLGDVASADRFIGQALATLRDDDVTAESETNMHLGLVRAAQNREAEAEAALRRAVEVAAATPYANVAIPAALHLAIFLARRGRSEEARDLADRYIALKDARGFHVFDPLADEFARLDKTGRLV